MGKPFPAPGMLFVESEATPNQIQYLIMGQNPGNFHAKSGMTSEPSAQKDTESGFNGFQGSSWADPHAFSAGKAGLKVYFRAIIIQGNSLFRADVHTSLAGRAGLGSDAGDGSADDADVRDLGAGAGIGTV